MRTGRLFCGVLGAALLCGLAASSHAASLAEQLEGIVPVGDRLDSFVPRLQLSAVRGTDFPVTSTTPGFTYRYNPELGIFERSTGSLGPALLERAETVGKGRFNLGALYLFADFQELDGRDLKGLTFPFASVAFGTVQFGSGTYTRFKLQSNMVAFFGDYGLTDRWDVNLFVPLFVTTLDVEARLRGTALATQTTRARDEKVGIGDILLRSKYILDDRGPVNLATGLTLRMPSGDETNFQGLGDFMLTPFFVASKAVRGTDFHALVGIETNAQDVERSRGRYGVGVSLQVIDRLAILADFIGSSGFTDNEITSVSPIDSRGLSAADFAEGLEPGAELQTGRVTTIVSPDPRTDILDFAAGVKVNVYGSVVGFLSAVIPINSDGLRADVVPVGGVEVTF